MGNFFMTKRIKFKLYRDDGLNLKWISDLMGVSEKTTKRWNKELKEGTLIRQHGLFNKVSNRRSIKNRKLILQEYLDSCLLITSDKKAMPYNFSYFIKYKAKTQCSLSTFKNIMKENLIASPWANKKTKKAYNKILKQKNNSKLFSAWWPPMRLQSFHALSI